MQPAPTESSASHPSVVLRVEPLELPWATPDPFLFCMYHEDHYPEGNERMGPAASLAGRDIGQDFARKDGWSMYHGNSIPGFPPHPHRGFETVTIVRQGLVDHFDSAGAVARYGNGDVQWLTAGKGIVHSEMFPLLKSQEKNTLELFQIWLNLPKVNKFAEPHFAMFWNEAVPRKTTRDEAGRATEVTVIAGPVGEVNAPAPPPASWASRPDSEVAIWTIKMAPGARYSLPKATAGTNRSLYFFGGSEVRVGGVSVPPMHRVELRPDAEALLENGADASEFLLLQGRPIQEPVVQYGPFVMNTDQEIRQAFEDYRKTRFGGWRWESEEPVHPREEGRFARRPDGSLDKP